MALRKRNLKLTVTALALVSVLSSSVGVNNVYADSNTNTVAIERSLEDKVYSVKNTIEYIKDGEIITSGHGYNSLREALSEETIIEVKNNKIYMTLEFTESQYNLIDNIKIKVDGKEIKFTKSDNRKYTVELSDMNSKVELTYDVNVPIPNLPPHTFTVNVNLADTNLEEKNEAPSISASNISIYVGDEFNALSDVKANDKEDGNLTSNIKIVSNNVNTAKAGTYNVTYEVTDSKGATITKTIIVTVKEKEVEVEKPNTLADGKYKIKNTTKYTGSSSMGSSMVRNSLKEVSNIEVENKQVYVTLEFSSDLHQYMKNIKITVDNKEVSPTSNGAKYRFKVDSLNSKIEVSAYITAMGMNIDYIVGLNESTLEKLSEGTSSDNSSNNDNNSNGSSSNNNNSNESSGNTSSNGNNSNQSSTDNSSSNSNSSNESSTETAVKKGKLYTIKNTVNHESETGREMARKYLNSTSKVEEIDGKYYVTLTFTGSDFMKNHAIYVNGSKVSHTVASKSGDSISLRFRVTKLSDSIKVGMYVVPMSRDIQFSVKLLENTLTFVKDYEISTESGTSLPQTGSIFNTATGIGAGSALVALGGLLNRRKRK